MKMIFLSLIALVWMSETALTQSPLTGAEFDAYTSGKTLTFMESGRAYGIEQYRPRRQVKWAFEDGECQDGEWYEPEPGLICFEYENTHEEPQCWNFFRAPAGLTARFANDPDSRELYETRQSNEPLICLGPEMGV